MIFSKSRSNWQLRLINGHEDERNRKLNQKNQAEQTFQALKKGDIGYKQAKKDYKKALRDYNTINKKYEAVQNAIQSIQTADNALYNAINDLNAPDGREVNVYVYSKNQTTKGKSGQYGDTQFTYGVRHIQRLGGQAVDYHIPSIPRNRGFLNEGQRGVAIQIYAFQGASTLANEFGDAQYAVQNSVRNKNEHDRGLPYLQLSTTQFSFDVEEQYKRNLAAFLQAHPDFIRSANGNINPRNP